MESTTEQIHETIKKTSKRLDSETGHYNAKPLDPNYFNDYYHKHNIKLPCAFCGKAVGKLKMFRHLKTTRCMKAQIELAKGDEGFKKHDPNNLPNMFMEYLRQLPLENAQKKT